ncbi:Hypothetical predicted protein, partial [Mytilus galloprovincialis]
FWACLNRENEMLPKLIKNFQSWSGVFFTKESVGHIGLQNLLKTEIWLIYLRVLNSGYLNYLMVLPPVTVYKKI